MKEEINDDEDFIYKLYSTAAEAGVHGYDLVMNSERTTLELHREKVVYYISIMIYQTRS